MRFTKSIFWIMIICTRRTSTTWHTVKLVIIILDTIYMNIGICIAF